jgi:sugar O-acyltransferase (sialic acid O-acetyltransferase NeuD family)
MSARRLIILGTGGSALDALDVLDGLNAGSPTWELVGFLDDVREQGSDFHGFPVLGPLKDALRHEDCSYLNVIGSDQSYRRRPMLITATGIPPERVATLVHPGACVSKRAVLGRGVLVNYGASIAGNVTVGDQVSIGPNCTVGHDGMIEDFAMLAPACKLSGFVHVGRCAYVGAAASVRQRLVIGAEALIGMGAVVVKDVFPGDVVAGNPARSLSPDLLNRAGEAPV